MNNYKSLQGLSHYRISKNGDVFSYYRRKVRQLKAYKVGAGYMCVRLTKDDGTEVQRYVHRLVATAFIDNPQALPEVNHIDENKENNNVSNLEWCTRLYNMRYGTQIERANLSRKKTLERKRKH